MLITSRDNSLLRLARSTRDGKTEDLVFIEGMRLSEEALRSGLKIEAVIISDELARKERVAPLLGELEQSSDRYAIVSEKLLESVSYTKTPQGVVVLAVRPDAGKDRLSETNPGAAIVVMHRINNPVNVGAILRTAEAAGASGVIATKETSDPFSPKSLRGAMGSAFRLPIWFGPSFDETLAWCKARKLQTICADVHASNTHDQADWRGPFALILGPESTGLSKEEVSAADESVRIPMQGLAESLNVGVAAGVLLYEVARQRRGDGQ